MTCGIFGPGLVGCFLGAAAGSPWTVCGPRGRPRASQVRFAERVVTWQPRVVNAPVSDLPLLVTTRVHQTPWDQLPLTVLAAQNGLGQPRPVATCVFAVDLDHDGVLHATGPQPRIVVGPLSNAWEPALQAWAEAGIVVERVRDPRAAQWEKAVLNATVGPLCLVTGRTMAAVWNDGELRALTLAATAEGEAIMRAAGIAVVPGIGARAAAFFAAVGDHQPSAVRDPGELPWVLGVLLQEAERLRLTTPSLRRIAEQVTTRLASMRCG